MRSVCTWDFYHCIPSGKPAHPYPSWQTGADLSLNGLKYLQMFASNWPAVHVRNACLKIISKFQFKQDSSLGVVEGKKTWNFVGLSDCYCSSSSTASPCFNFAMIYR